MSDPTGHIVEAASATEQRACESKLAHSLEIQKHVKARQEAEDPEILVDLSQRQWKALRSQRRQRYQLQLDMLAQKWAGGKKLGE